jgi:hypothetical protein
VLNYRKAAREHLMVAREIAERSASVPFRARVAYETFLLLRDASDRSERSTAASALQEVKRLAGSIGMDSLTAQVAAERV